MKFNFQQSSKFQTLITLKKVNFEKLAVYQEIFRIVY